RLLRRDVLAHDSRQDDDDDVTPQRRRSGQRANYTRCVSLFTGDAPILTLAPMQAVTNGAFWTLIHQYGGADVYWTEYFRVHSTSTPEKHTLDSIRKNSTGRPAIAQMIGNDIPALVRTAKALQQYAVGAIDL